MIQLSGVYCLNEIGGRPQNEDAVWPMKGAARTDDRLFLVCDGVGGNSHGEVAAALTCEGFADYFKTHLPPAAKPDATFIRAAQASVLEGFRRYVLRQPAASQMSSTLTLAYINGHSIMVAWCGDSRVYHIRNGEVLFRTADHSLVGELVKSGELTPEEAERHPHKNIILRAIQLKDTVSKIDTVELTDIRSGDFVLLCSDGLMENITPQVLAEQLSGSHPKEFDVVFQELCHDRTRDNYSMYLLHI